jgi:transcriptional regulator with GAF, ATPase, and Fis domain
MRFLRSGITWFANQLGWRRGLILLSAALVCAYTGCVLWYALARPDIGIHFSFSQSVHEVAKDHFRDPESSANPGPDDRILEIGSEHVGTWAQAVHALNLLRDQPKQSIDSRNDLDGLAGSESGAARTYVHAKQEGEDWVRVRFQRKGEAGEQFAWCRVEGLPLETVLPSILWFILKGGLFAVGALVFWNRRGDRPAMMFFVWCTVTCMAYMGGYHWQRISTQPVLLLIFIASAVLLPACSLHFFLVFPRPKAFFNRRPGWTLAALYGLPVAFCLLLIWDYFQVREMTLTAEDAVLLARSERLRNEAFVYFGVAALWYFACVVSLVHSYRSAANATEHNQVRWIMIGALVASVFIGITLYLAFARPADFGAGAGTWWMFLASVCFTAAFAFSISRYRLMELDQLIGAGVIYFLVSCFFGLAYYALVFTSMWLLGNHQMSLGPVGQALSFSGSVLVLLIVFDLVRGRVKKALDRHFRREKYQLDRTLRRMSAAIEQLVDPPTLARRLLHTAADVLGATRGAVYLREGDPPLYRLTDRLGVEPALGELSPGCPLIEALSGRGTLVNRPGPFAMAPAQRQLQFLGGELAHAVVHEGEMLALVVLGPRDGSPYSADDLNLLAAFARMTALALVSAEGHRTIEALNQDLQGKVSKIAEQQRRISTLQTQLLHHTRTLGAAGETPRPTIDVDGQPVINDESEPARTFVGSSMAVHQLLQVVHKVAASPSAVLLRGESGTGKELLARALHDASPRAAGPFVKVHCAALSAGLLESELFGHVRGAFTGAHRDKVGRFELAHGGSLFLDEIGDISLEVQTKLLRVLQEMTFERVGSSEPIEVDVRLITATHQDLEALIRQGRFREDLYYRLKVISIPVPPLRDRPEDIVELAHHFLQVFSRRSGKEVAQIDDDALAALKGYPWPGNIRQLENVLERAVVIADGPIIAPSDLPPEFLNFQGDLAPVNGETLSDTLPLLRIKKAGRPERDRLERDQLVRALASAAGNKAEAARALGLARSTFFSKLKKHGLS